MQVVAMVSKLVVKMGDKKGFVWVVSMVEEMVVWKVVIQVVAMVAKKVGMKDDLLGGEKAAKMAVEMDDILVFVWVAWMVE